MAWAVAKDGTRISYEVIGKTDAPALVMIQGLGVDRWGWVRQQAAFATKYRVVLIDNRGAGRSDKPHGPYELEVMADDVLAVLDREEIDSAHVMGASLGGVLAQIMAVRSVGRVDSLVLACTACRVKDWRRELLAEWIELAETGGTSAFALENLRWVISNRHLRWLSPLSQLVAPLAVRAPAHGVVAQMHAILSITEQVHELLATVTVPTLVIVGSQDILTPVADSEEIAAKIPGAELCVVAGAAHGMMVTDARVFNREVRSFLAAV